MAQKCHDTNQGEKVNLDLHKNKIAIVGQTNVGKSILFNKFSHSYSTVANYPQTTIAALRKDSIFAGKPFEIIDTPGISSLNIMSEDEQVTRNILIQEHPELILFCGDATRLKRTLVLLTQLLELEIPTVFCLNMADEASRKGIAINIKDLTAEVGTTVVETAAIHGIGLKSLEKTSTHVHSQNGSVHYPDVIEKALDKLLKLFPVENQPSKGILLLFLSGDEEISGLFESRYGKELASKAKKVLLTIYRKTSAANIRQAVFDARENWADVVAEKTTRKASLTLPGLAQKLAWASRHPILGWPILLGILWITFYGVATIAAEMATLLDTWIFIPMTNAISLVITYPFLNEFLVGNFGILTMGVMNALVTVVPILIVFFLIINFLEDVGYLPNLSVLANRALAYVGLSGKSVLPLVLGFGCNTMATLTSRMMETKKERIIVSSLIALGVPCAVQLGVMIAILASAPFSALLIVLSSVIATQIICGIAMDRLVPTKRKSDFIMELPSFRMPDLRHIMIKTYHRVKWFLVEALPLFVLGAAIMFVLEKTGLLDVIKALLRPVVSGFLSMPDKMTEVFILVLSRRELGAVYFKDFVDAGGLDYYQIVVGLVTMTLFIPCVSNTMVMIKELGMRWAISINIGIIIIAILVGGLLNFLIRLF